MKHLVDLHGPPLTRGVRRHTLHTTTILLPLLLRKEEIPIYLQYPKHPRNIPDNCYSRHQEVPGKEGVQQVHGVFPIDFVAAMLGNCCAVLPPSTRTIG